MPINGGSFFYRFSRFCFWLHNRYANARNFLNHPLFFLIVSVISIGFLRAIAIPLLHNYDEYAHFMNIRSLDLSRCGTEEGCLSFLYSFIPALRSDSQRGVFYYLSQTAIQFILPQDFDNGERVIVARLFTSILYVPIIVFSYLTLQELFPSDKRLAIFTAGVVGLLPSFSDIMSGVNIDASAALIGSVIVYTSARLIKRGVTLGLLIALGIEIYIGYTTKGTVWPLFLVILFSFWLLLPNRYRKWSIGVLALVSLLLSVFIIRPLWYGVGNWFYSYPPRETGTIFLPSQAIESQVVGRYSLEANRLESENSVVVQYVPDYVVHNLRGKTVTFGVWARAEDGISTKVSLPQCHVDQIMSPLETLLSDHWEFLSSSFNVPADAQYLRCVLSFSQSGGRTWYDGMVLVEGNVSKGQLPLYENSDASSVVWGDKHHINLFVNPSAEQSWLQVNPSLGYPFSVNQRIVSLLSWQLTMPSWWALTRWSIVSFWATFGGEQPGLSSRQMLPLALITALAIAGVFWTLIVDLPRHQHYLKQVISRRGFSLLLFTVLAIFSLIVYRADIIPFRSVILDFSSMRHASAGWTAISAVLALGLLRWVPRQYQKLFVASTIVVLFVLNMHIFLRVQLPLYLCSYNAPIQGGQTCLWILPLD